MSPRELFSSTLKKCLDNYYPGWDDAPKFLPVKPNHYRSVKEGWTKNKTPSSSDIFLEILGALTQIPSEDKEKLIKLETAARKRIQAVPASKSDIQEFEHKGIQWREEIPRYLTIDQKIVISAGVELFRHLIVEEVGSLELRRSRVGREFGDHAYDTFKIALRSGALSLMKVPRHEELEEELKRKFPRIESAYVANVSPQIGGTLVRTELVVFLAATEVMPYLKVKHAGIGGGYTMLRLAEQAYPTDKQFGTTQWMPLNRFKENPIDTHSPHHVASILAHHYSTKTHTLSLRSMIDSHDSHRQNDETKFLEVFDDVHALLMSVNGPGRGDNQAYNSGTDKQSFQWRSADFQKVSNFFPVIRLIEQRDLYHQIAGEFVGHILDDNGQSLGEDVERELDKISERVRLSLLKQVPLRGKSIVVGARGYKARPILMGIRNNMFNSLVIDSEIAMKILELNEKSPGD